MLTPLSQDARAQSQRTLVFGTSESVPYGTLLELLDLTELLGDLSLVRTEVTVSASANGPFAQSVDLTGDGALTCSAGNGQVTFSAGDDAASATCHARVCATTLGLVTICRNAAFDLRAVECQAGAGRVDQGCSADAPACDVSGEPTCVGCTEDLHCGARSPIIVAVGQVVRVADDLLRQLLGVSLNAILTNVTVSATVNGPFTDEAILDTDVACRVNADGQVEVIAGAGAEGTATCHVRACVLGLLCTEAPLDILVDLCLVGGECNPVATCDTTRQECVACRDDRGPGQIDSGCSSAQPSCETDGGVARCVECDSDADCEASLLSTLLGPEQEVTVALAQILEFLRLSTNLLPSSLAVSGQVDGPFGNEALLGADVAVANCGVTVDGDIRISSNHLEADVTCYVQVCAAILGDTITTCVTAPIAVQVDACVLRNDCGHESICLADSTCATCADTVPAGQVDRGCGGDTPACDGGTCVECLADADCNISTPLLNLDLGETGLISRDLLLTSVNLGLGLLIDTLEVGATVNGPFGERALVDVGAEVTTCQLDLDGNLHVLAPDTVYGQVTCHVRACAEVATISTCVVIPVEINVDPCASRGDCRPPICADQRCQACADDGPGVVDRGCGEAAPACREDSGICVECTHDLDCGGGDICDLSNNRCVPCVDTGDGVDHGCTPETPICNTAELGGPRCEACLDDSVGAIDTGCNSTLPACEVQGGTCEECTVDADCDAGNVCTNDFRCVPCDDTGDGVDHGCTPETPICNTTELGGPRCEACLDDSVGAIDTGCNSTLPACEVQGGTCEECTVDADCDAGNVCTSDFRCVPCDDEHGECTTPNHPPIGLDDEVNTPEDVAILVVVSANDIDPDGHAFAARSIAVAPRNGSASVLPDGTVLYRPHPDFTGADVLTYETCDELDACSHAHLWIDVLPVNDAPDVFDDYAQTSADTAVTTNVLANDIDRDGDVLVVAEATVSQGTGEVSFEATGEVTYTPSASDSGLIASIRYMACDPHGACESATLSVGVDAGELPAQPLVQDDTATTPTGEPLLIDVLANDIAPEGTELMIASWTVGQSGAVWAEDGVIHYAPRIGWVGSDTFRYTACTEDGRCGSATVLVEVTSDTNLPPLALSDDITTVVDVPVTFDPTLNDIDPEGEEITVVSVFAPNHGTAEIVDGLVRYVPAAGFVGEDRFGVTVSDASGLTASSGVRVQVLPAANTAPVAEPDEVFLAPGIAGVVDVLANDFDPDGDPMQFHSIEQPMSGLVTIFETGDRLMVQMNASFIGVEHFVYRITDGRGGYAAAAVMVVVQPGNEPPVAEDDVAEVDEDDVVTVDVLANDFDPEGDPLLLAGLPVLPRHGTAEIVNRGVRYVPSADFFGTDSFAYRVCDLGGSCSQALVAMTVNPVNDAPEANDDQVTVRISSETLLDVLANDIDVDGDPLALTIVAGPAEGTALVADGRIRFAAPSTPTVLTFTYEACDVANACDQATVTVTVTDGPVGGPIAVDDEATTLAGRTVSIDVLANDDHATPGTTLHVGELSQPADGTVERNGDRVVYRPALGFTGVSVFGYQACDTVGACDEAQVTVTVTQVPGNSAPVANPDEFIVQVGSSVTLDVLANDIDADGDTLTVTAVTPFTGSTLGRVELDGGVVRFTATTRPGEGSFEYTVCDASACDTATVSVAVSPKPEEFAVTGGPGCQGGASALWMSLLGFLAAIRLARR